MTAEDILCRWFEAQFDLAEGSVAEVKMEEGFDSGYSEMTPGIGAYLDISGYDEKGKHVRSMYETDYAEAVISVARFAAERITT